MHLVRNSRLPDDPTWAKLEEIARRLYVLLQRSNNREEDMLLAEQMLVEADLFNQGLPDWRPKHPRQSLFRFCNRLIAENPLLYQAIDEVRIAHDHLDLVDNVEELIQMCIPSEADVGYTV
jgi:hypothetical protein